MQGRQRAKWAGDIEEWTARPFSDAQALAHNRDRWKAHHKSTTKPTLRIKGSRQGKCCTFGYI